METKNMHPVTDAPATRSTSGSRMRRFVFTLNNWTQPEYDWLVSSLPTLAKWAVIGKENGKEGTAHLQGAVVLNKQTSFSTIKTWTGFARAHWCSEVLNSEVGGNTIPPPNRT